MDSTRASVSPLALGIGLVKLLRPQQWVKNGFVLAPLIFSGEFLNPTAISNNFFAVFLFCIAASACYVLNDICDVEQDRSHPTKRLSRPLASGLVSVNMAITLLISLYAIFIYGYFISPSLFFVVLGYLLLNVAYTFVLKHQVVLDIFAIAMGFVLRVHAGAVAISMPVSSWMFVTTLCLALYLASIKRRQELKKAGTESRAVLKKYSITLINRYAEMSATGALVFYSMFVVSTKPQLVMTIPFVLFGLFRYWYWVEVEEGGESPTDALLNDWQLLLTVMLWAGTCIWALWPGVN